MLPYTPLHHLLLRECGFPVVATSGNVSGDPLCWQTADALARLRSIADGVLSHDRPIARPVDDSIVRWVLDRPLILRRARGYAPLPLVLGQTDPAAPPSQLGESENSDPVRPDADIPLTGTRDRVIPQGNHDNPTILALGSHLKNTIALYHQGQVILSPHIGDLDTLRSRDRLLDTLTTLCRLYELRPTLITCDAHPDYSSSQLAQTLAQIPVQIPAQIPAQTLAPSNCQGKANADRSSATDSTAGSHHAPSRDSIPILPVQHHYAHIRAVMAEKRLKEPVLGIAWDGMGLGLDGTLWGGEFLRVGAEAPPPGFVRVAHWREFPLPGGDRAARKPRRSALGLLHSLGDRDLLAQLQPQFSAQDWRILNQALDRDLNCPRTSSIGRLFDAIAALLGLGSQCSFEGQGAMAVEFAATKAISDPSDPLSASLLPQDPLHPLIPTLPQPSPQDDRPWILDWEPLVRSIGIQYQGGTSPNLLALTFHEVLVQTLVRVAQRVGIGTIVLSGGCFQNRLLLTRSVTALRSAGFDPHWSQQFPPNDGGLALGQIAAVLPWLSSPQSSGTP